MNTDSISVSELYNYIKDFLSDYKVSKPTLYNYINTLKKEIPENQHDLYFKKEGNRLLLTERATERIFEMLGIPTETTEQNTDYKASKQNENQSVDSDAIRSMSETIQILNQRLEAQDQQIELMHKEILNLTEAINAFHQMNHNETYIRALKAKQGQMTEQTQYKDSPEESQGLFRRFIDYFKRK